MSHTKWCHICGLSVDLRKKGSIELSSEFSRDIPNPEYRYVCSKCTPKHREEMDFVKSIIFGK